MRTKKSQKNAKPFVLNEELREANDRQLQIYLGRYDQFWRLHKLYCLRFLLGSREALHGLVKDIYADQKVDNEQIIYNNITNGILADATSELVMLCEDYFSLLRFIREPLRFVKKAISYSAGSVTNLPKKLREPDAEMLRKIFFIPGDDICTAVFAHHDLGNAHTNMQVLQAQLESLKGLHHSAITFYDKHSDFHIQYKHGLKLALRGLHGSQLPAEEVARRKQELSVPLFAFENKPTNQLGYGSAMMIPDIGFEPIRKNLGLLHEDLNLLHLQFLHDVNINECIELGKKIVLLIQVLIDNRMSLVNNRGTRQLRFILTPEHVGELQCQVYQFDTPLGYVVPTLLDFQID